MKFIIALILFFLFVPSVYAATNLVTNPGIETKSGWLLGGYGNNTGILTHPSEGANGSIGAKSEITVFKDGDRKWYFSDIPVTPGTYLYEDQFKANVPSRLVVRFTTTPEKFIYQDIGILAASSGWQKASGVITVPKGVTSLTVFHLIESVGTINIDTVSVTNTSPTPSPTPSPTATPSPTPKPSPTPSRKRPPNTFSQPMVSIDFDDGWLSAYKNALPLLNKAGLKTTQYVITNFSFTGNPLNVNKEQILFMKSGGHEIGSHSRTHPDLTTLTSIDLRSELNGSRRDLLSLTNLLPSSFAYPYGLYNATVQEAVRKTGYRSGRSGVTEDEGINYRNLNRYALKSFVVQKSHSMDEIKSWIDQTIATNGWSIIVFHQVDEGGGDFSISPTNLQTIIDYIKEKNVKVVTSSQALELL